MYRMRTIALLILPVVLSGCLLDATLQWSQDGTVGLLGGTGLSLSIIDGTNGQVHRMPWNDIASTPSLSRDGKLMAFVNIQRANDIDDVLQRIPQAQAARVSGDAEQLLAACNSTKEAMDANSLFAKAGVSSSDIVYRGIVADYLLKRVSAQGIHVPESLLVFRNINPLRFYDLLVAPSNASAADQGRSVAASAFPMRMPQLSPDKRWLAYLIQTGVESASAPTFHLCLTSTAGSSSALLASNVSQGFAWREDSRTMVCIAALEQAAVGGFALGSLKEMTIIDLQGHLYLRSQPKSDARRQDVVDQRVEPIVSQLAGLFFHRSMKATYGARGRILLAAIRASLPVGSVEGEPTWSLFCCDPAYGTVVNILPPKVSEQLDEAVVGFQVSPDGSHVLIPTERGTLLVYALGSPSAATVQTTKETDKTRETTAILFGWKGSDRFTCLLAGNSPLLAGSPYTTNELGIYEFDVKGVLIRELTGPSAMPQPIP